MRAFEERIIINQETDLRDEILIWKVNLAIRN